MNVLPTGWNGTAPGLMYRFPAAATVEIPATDTKRKREIRTTSTLARLLPICFSVVLAVEYFVAIVCKEGTHADDVDGSAPVEICERVVARLAG